MEKLPQDLSLYFKYLDLLEYVGISLQLSNIKALCNVNFSGRLVINTEGIFNKCWEEIENSDLSFGHLDEDINTLIDIMTKVDLDLWGENSERKKLDGSEFYFITDNSAIIGKVNIIKSNDILGIYDFEINPQLRGQGIGAA